MTDTATQALTLHFDGLARRIDDQGVGFGFARDLMEPLGELHHGHSARHGVLYINGLRPGRSFSWRHENDRSGQGCATLRGRLHAHPPQRNRWDEGGRMKAEFFILSPSEFILRSYTWTN